MGKIDLRVDLKDEIAKKFRYLKGRLGFPTNTSVLIHLINESYERFNPGERGDVFDWIKEKTGEVFQAIDEQGITREEAEKRIRKVLEESKAKLCQMIPEG